MDAPYHADHRRADGAGDVVVAGRDVDDQRAQGVKGRLVAELHFFFHLQLDLIHGDVAGTFDHDLHVVLPGFFGELAEDAAVRLNCAASLASAMRAGTQAVAQ